MLQAATFQVEIRGFRVEPDEIAEALDAHPAVARAAVTTWELDRRDPRLVAYVVLEPDSVVGPVELRAHLAALLPAHMVPDTFVNMASLPLTSSGGVDRAALPPPFTAAREPGPAEERIAG